MIWEDHGLAASEAYAQSDGQQHWKTIYDVHVVDLMDTCLFNLQQDIHTCRYLVTNHFVQMARSPCLHDPSARHKPPDGVLIKADGVQDLCLNVFWPSKIGTLWDMLGEIVKYGDRKDGECMGMWCILELGILSSKMVSCWWNSSTGTGITMVDGFWWVCPGCPNIRPFRGEVRVRTMDEVEYPDFRETM